MKISGLNHYKRKMGCVGRKDRTILDLRRGERFMKRWTLPF